MAVSISALGTVVGHIICAMPQRGVSILTGTGILAETDQQGNSWLKSVPEGVALTGGDRARPVS